MNFTYNYHQLYSIILIWDGFASKCFKSHTFLDVWSPTPRPLHPHLPVPSAARPQVLLAAPALWAVTKWRWHRSWGGVPCAEDSPNKLWVETTRFGGARKMNHDEIHVEHENCGLLRAILAWPSGCASLFKSKGWSRPLENKLEWAKFAEKNYGWTESVGVIGCHQKLLQSSSFRPAKAPNPSHIFNFCRNTGISISAGADNSISSALRKKCRTSINGSHQADWTPPP